MRFLLIVLVLLLAYLIGSIPFGLLIVRLKTGKDIRNVESGRTGGTNAMRAAGFGAGFATAVLDMLKAASTVWLARVFFPTGADPLNVWIQTFAPLLAILGHNYPIYLLRKTENGGFKFSGGAGGAPCVGGSVGLWAPSLFIIIPIAALILFGIGYASVATMSVALISAGLFAILAATQGFPWQYVLYGLAAEALLIWALRPNIRRLFNGTERLIGWRAKRKKGSS